MLRINILSTILCIFALTTLQSLSAMQLNVMTPAGETISLDVQPEETLDTVFRSMEGYLEENNCKATDCTYDFFMHGRNVPKKTNRDYDYNRPVSASELSDIRYIVLTLSNTPLLKLRKYRKDIENAGDRINNVHPLNFWRVIFTDREMIAAIHNIKGRDRIWRSFINGSVDGFTDAVELNMMQPENIQDFANRVGIDVNIITGPLQDQEWTHFIKLLLIHIPRDGTPDRYNM